MDLPTTKVHEVAIKKLTDAFSNQFSVRKAERRWPRILVSNVPGEITEQSFKSFLLQKEDALADMINNYEVFEIERSWKQKHMPESTAQKNFVIKCSLKVRNFIMNKNNGYVFIQLMRCRVHDYVDPQMCFHCRRFGAHVAMNCPDKEKSPTCLHCMGSHDGKSCRQNNNQKCCNCARNKTADISHSALSKKCPAYLSARKAILKKLDFLEDPISTAERPGGSSKN